MVSSQLYVLNELLPISFIKIEKGWGSFLTFEAEEKELCLWIYLTDWAIYHNQISLLNCMNEREIDYVNVLCQLKKNTLLEIKENLKNERIEFIFTNGYELHIWADTEMYNFEDELFMCFLKKTIISYSLKNRFYVEKRSFLK